MLILRWNVGGVACVYWATSICINMGCRILGVDLWDKMPWAVTM